MSAKTVLPIVAAMSAIGAGTGIWLGHAAVGDIDPVFFSNAPTSFVADRVASRPPDWAGVQIGEYQQQGLLDGISAAPPSNAVYAAPAIATYGDSWAADTVQETEPVRATAYRPAAEPVREDVREMPVDPDLVRVHRYASYPVSREEAEVAEVVEDEGAAPDVYAAVYEAPAE